MAITDNGLQYCAAQAVSATAASTNVIDHGTDRDIGIGEPMAVQVTCDVALAGTTPTFQVELQVASTPGGSYAAILASGSFSAVAAGQRIILPVPPDTSFDRASRLRFVTGGTTPTITVTANLIPMRFVQAEAYGPTAFVVQ